MYPISGLDRPVGLQEIETPITYGQSAHEGGKISPTHRPAASTLRRYPWFSFRVEAESTLGPYATGSIRSMKNSSDFVGNRNRYLPACSAVPHTTAPPRISKLLRIFLVSFESTTRFTGHILLDMILFAAGKVMIGTVCLQIFLFLCKFKQLNNPSRVTHSVSRQVLTRSVAQCRIWTGSLEQHKQRIYSWDVDITETLTVGEERILAIFERKILRKIYGHVKEN